MLKNQIDFNIFNKLILQYIDLEHPKVEDSLLFIGGLIREVIQRIDISKEEKFFYADLYRQIINKKLGQKLLSG